MRKYAIIISLAALAVLLLLLTAGWNPRSGEIDQAAQRDLTVDKLRSLPYAEWSEPVQGNLSGGVTYYDANRSYPGLNLYNSRHRTEAYLIDMTGRVVRRWGIASEGPETEETGWHNIRLGDNLSLYAVVKQRYLAKFDRDSRQLWSVDGWFHHDLDVSPEGDIYAIASNVTYLECPEGRLPVLDDQIAVLSQDGREISRLSLARLFKDNITAERRNGILREIEKSPGHFTASEDSAFDVLHTNSVFIIPRAIPGVASKGDILVSIRELDTIAVIDPVYRQVRWTWGPGILDKQHHATVLDNGDFLVFDNRPDKSTSRVVEVDPRTRQIVWEYAGNGTSFKSNRRGAAQGLENGNTLITDSESGRAFEVTRSGEIVWDFFNPENYMGRRGSIYRVQRITDHLPPA
jgi:hypothetical protein